MLWGYVLWHVFADLDRNLDDEERGTLSAAIDELVPDSGCVGPNRSGDEEVYFAVEAPSAEAAREAAAGLLERVMVASGVRVGVAITVQAPSSSDSPLDQGP
jgi:hypothetical protein